MYKIRRHLEPPDQRWNISLCLVYSGPFFFFFFRLVVGLRHAGHTLGSSVSSYANRKLCSYFQMCYFKGALRSLGETPPLARISPCNELTPDMIYPACEFQSKQQLAVFSSLRFRVDPLRKAFNSLHRNPPDIPTRCFSDTDFYLFFAALLKLLCWNKTRAKK